MQFLRVMNDLINLSQVVRFELHTDMVRVFYAVPELYQAYDGETIGGSRLSYETYIGPAAAQLRDWLTAFQARSEVGMFEL